MRGENCGVFGVTPDGACSTHRAIRYFFTENHLHRQAGCTDILIYVKLSRVSHTHFVFRKLFPKYHVQVGMGSNNVHNTEKFKYKTHANLVGNWR